MHDAGLASTYERTHYRVRLACGGHATIRIGASLPPALAMMLPTADAPWAFVTAWNPRSQRLERAENRRRERRLVAQLRAAGRAIHAGLGVAEDGAWREPGVFVAGLPFDHLDALMAPFDQHAIVRGRGMQGAELHWYG